MRLLRMSSDKVLILSYFVGIILLGSAILSLPFAWLGPSRLSFIDALFTSTSAVCVTGLISVPTELYSRFGQIVILILIEAGGLGIVTFTTVYLIIPRKKISLVNRGLIRDFSIDEISYEPRRILIGILSLTLGIETIGALSLWMAFTRASAPDPLFSAVFHSISAFCNAGFSTFPNNLESYVMDTQVNISVMLLIVLGGLGFMVTIDVINRLSRRKRLLSSYSVTVIIMTIGLIVSGSLCFMVAEWNGAYARLAPAHKIMAAFFQAISPRTAGFDTVAQTSLNSYSVLFCLVLMFIGGSSGSTAGGIKTSTAYILGLLALRGVDETNGSLVVRGRAIPNSTVIKAVQILLKAVTVIFLSCILICALENGRIASGEIRIIQVAFEACSAFATVGLSLGITASLGAPAKLILILTMFIGRVGLVTMALPNPGKTMERYVDFASANHIVG